MENSVKVLKSSHSPSLTGTAIIRVKTPSATTSLRRSICRSIGQQWMSSNRRTKQCNVFIWWPELGLGISCIFLFEIFCVCNERREFGGVYWRVVRWFPYRKSSRSMLDLLDRAVIRLSAAMPALSRKRGGCWVLAHSPNFNTSAHPASSLTPLYHIFPLAMYLFRMPEIVDIKVAVCGKSPQTVLK